MVRTIPPPGAVTFTLSDAAGDCVPCESVTCTEKVTGPAVPGIPLRMPVRGSRLSQSDAPEMDHCSPPTPPLAVSVCQ